jgi:hypothetical protein
MLSLAAKPHVLPTPIKSLLGFCDLIIDDVIIISDFKVFEGKNGLFIKNPSKKTNQKDEQGNDKYLDTVRFLDAKENEKDWHTPLQKEAYEVMITEFKKAMGKGSPTSESSTERTTDTKTPAGRPANPFWNG